jgi:hypothetical protein
VQEFFFPKSKKVKNENSENKIYFGLKKNHSKHNGHKSVFEAKNAAA